MNRRMTRRGFLAGLGAGMSTTALADAPLTSLRPVLRPAPPGTGGAEALRAIIRDADLGPAARISFTVADARSGRIIEARHPLLRLPPASVAKAATALYGLDRLGAGHRFRTRLIATGPVTGGRLNGDLILAGGGDPTLDTDRLAQMARALKSAGVHEVAGRFAVHGGALPRIRAIDAAQPEHLSYNPAISGLNLNYNRVHFGWRRTDGDYQVTMGARAEHHAPEVSTTGVRIVDRDRPAYAYAERRGDGGDGGGDGWTVARGALGDKGARWLPVRHPELYAAEVFGILARSYGITLRGGDLLPGDALPRGTVLAESESAPLSEILTGMLRYSTNLTAEVVGLSAAGQGGDAPPGSLRASAARMNDWLGARYGLRRAGFADHSGLGGASRVSTGDMVRALVGAGPEQPLRPLLKRIDAGDVRGELRAKTGTLNFVSALAGYYRTAEGRDLAFAVFCADTGRRYRLSRAEMERPPGARGWSRRARRLHWRLLERWAGLSGA